MAHSGCLRGSGSPNTCRDRGDHRRPGRAKPLPRDAAEDDDWETDPDYVHDASRPGGHQRAAREISTTSIISDLSRAIRDCSLATSSPQSKKEPAGHQSPLPGCQDAGQSWAKKPPRERHRQQARSSPGLGIERCSVFNRNAVETLDNFFSGKLKAWASDTAQLSDGYENMEALQEEPPGHSTPPRGAGKAQAGGAGRTGRKPSHSRGPQARGEVAGRPSRSREQSGPPPGACCGQCLGPGLVGKGEASPAALPRRPEGSRPSTSVSSSARILPQCRIAHVQSCRACQVFNQDPPAGREEALCYEDSSGGGPPPRQEGGRDGLPAARRKGRTGASSQRPLPDRLSKVQQWLEQTPVERPAGLTPPQKLEGTRLAASDRPGRGAAYGRLHPKEGDAWDSLEPPAEARHTRKTHRGRNPNQQPVARILACDDTSTSPATCSCLYCEHQRPCAQPGKQGPDPSPEEVAVQLQAENRVPRIVEAFERRSLREAKRAERERAFQSARQREPERKARAAKVPRDARPDHPPASSGRARKPPSPEELRERPRPRTVSKGAGGRRETHRRRKEGEAGLPAGKRPSFMDRLRGFF
ncbi:uncharacterized protein LOC128322012 [Hemicordylus capensis]|uniref:uncharacterized protein LOC128322012 n=1 Tax=Hemicordylus capensis TaxID=884348 RepID=UPI0023027935|nr:uncharacterized protein LOC128322012 [Hemicordylus capensis]